MDLSMMPNSSVLNGSLGRQKNFHDDMTFVRRPFKQSRDVDNDLANFQIGETRSLHPNPAPMKLSRLKVRHFRLLDLPTELQRLVFFHYFGGEYDITLDYERLTMLRSRFHILGPPPLALLFVSKHVNTHSAELRRSLFTGRLILNSVFILVPLRRQERFQWLRDHTRILHFTDSSVRPERWARYFESFQKLKRLEIDFPMVKRLEREGGIDLEDVLAGREDELLLSSLDEFRMALVEQLRDGKMEVVVKQRYTMNEESNSSGWDGCVVVNIHLNDDGAKVVRYKHEPPNQDGGRDPTRRRAELVNANGNIIDQGSVRSIWEWYQAMNE